MSEQLDSAELSVIDSSIFTDDSYFDYLLTCPNIEDADPFFPDEKFSDLPSWSSKSYTTSSFFQNLHDEIKDFVHYSRPTSYEILMRMRLLERLENILTHIFPNSKVFTYGSTYTGLYLPNADIDIVCIIQDVEACPSLAVNQVCGVLESHNFLHIQALTSAHVPIAKAIDPITKIKIDISFQAKSGVDSSRQVKKLTAENPASIPLYLVLKRFLQQRGLNDVFSGGLGSYGLFLSIIGFLKLYSVAFAYQSDGELNLGRLLLDYFDFYCFKFNSDSLGITLSNQNATIFPKHTHFTSDKQNLCIEDPTDETNDVCRGTYNWRKVLHAYELAYKHLVALSRNCTLHSGTILSSILWYSAQERRTRVQSVVCFMREEGVGLVQETAEKVSRLSVDVILEEFFKNKAHKTRRGAQYGQKRVKS
ncbi:hypothetical protein P9112_002694 [Eukaryota sp. TZLM1-RC]